MSLFLKFLSLNFYLDTYKPHKLKLNNSILSDPVNLDWTMSNLLSRFKNILEKSLKLFRNRSLFFKLCKAHQENQLSFIRIKVYNFTSLYHVTEFKDQSKPQMSKSSKC